MAYMRKNVNLLLMLLLIIVIGSLVILTTLYQSNQKELSIQLAAKTQELEAVKANFTSKLSELNKTSTELQIRSADSEQLNTLYQGLTTERDILDAQLTATKEDLTDAVKQLNDLNKRVAELTLLTNQQKEELDELREENEDLENELTDVKDDYCDEIIANGGSEDDCP